MRRDIIASVVLFFTFLALLFRFFYPIYFTHGEIFFREVTVFERIFSVFFVLLWIALCLGSAYLKKLCLFIGGVLYALIPYGVSLGISALSNSAEGREVSIAYELLLTGLVRIHELVQAPLVGVSILFEPENGARLSFYLLPMLVLSYWGVQLFRFYRNAYLAEQLRLDDISPGLKRKQHIGALSVSEATSNGHRKMRVREPEKQDQKVRGTDAELSRRPAMTSQKNEHKENNIRNDVEKTPGDEKEKETPLDE